MYTYVLNRISLFLSEYDIFDGLAISSSRLRALDNNINSLGQESYNIVFKFAIFSCVISLIGIIVARLIFRIASPREDARAKMLIQTTLVITFIISMILTLFGIVIKLGGDL